MTEVAIRVAAAATLIWLGMVLAISFLEAPLKFRAEGLELRVGLEIGRIVFRALNVAEVVWAVVIAVCLTVTRPSGAVLALAAVTALLFAVQLLLVRPRLNRRSARVLAGQHAPRSRAHHAYIGLEALKLAALVALGAALWRDEDPGSDKRRRGPMSVHQPALEALGDHDYLVRFVQDEDTVVVRMHADPAVVAQIGDDEQRVVEATAAYLIARQSADDLPEQVDLDTVAAAYDGYVADLHHQLTPPSAH